MAGVAGDHALSGDEKRLSFGLGATPRGTMLDVVVRWPNGTTERFAGITAGGRFLLVQGAGTGSASGPSSMGPGI
ncbi:ASPIC/UnbV domain-containing protein [Alienimonas chondri]|uniref:ASPIC/UnbV domain-containing protein n=1 Tax=Alienimonas chondri TaxID=2681879 RepID=UPI0039C89435